MFEELYEDKLDGNTVILKYNVLPAKALLKAWTDTSYRDMVLEKPNTALKKYIINENIELISHSYIRDGEMKNFAIPYYENINALSSQTLKEKLKKERDNNKITYILPIDILAEAMMDAKFRKELINNPDKVLRDRGYDLGDYKYIVHEDTKIRKNIIVPNSPINMKQADYYKGQTQYFKMSCGGCHGTGRHNNSGTCCATGTCD